MGEINEVYFPFLAFYSPSLRSEPVADETAIRNIIANEIATWNTGDAIGYSRDFAKAGTLTNIRSPFFTGYEAFFQGIAPGTPGVLKDEKGRLRSRLLQVVAKQNGVWKIVSHHNVDVKPGIPVPEPK